MSSWTCHIHSNRIAHKTFSSPPSCLKTRIAFLSSAGLSRFVHLKQKSLSITNAAITFGNIFSQVPSCRMTSAETQLLDFPRGVKCVKSDFILHNLLGGQVGRQRFEIINLNMSNISNDKSCRGGGVWGEQGTHIVNSPLERNSSQSNHKLSEDGSATKRRCNGEVASLLSARRPPRLFTRKLRLVRFVCHLVAYHTL